MTFSNAVLGELDALLNSLADQELDETARVQLNQQLRTSPEAQQIYCDFIRLHAMLASDAVEGPTFIVPQQRFVESPVFPQFRLSLKSKRNWRRSMGLLVMQGHRAAESLVRSLSLSLRRPLLWSMFGVGLLFAGYVVLISWNMLGKQVAQGIGVRSQESGVSDLKSEIQNLKSEIRNPKSEIASVATIRDTADAQWSTAEGRGDRAQGTGDRNSQSKIRNPKSAISKGEPLQLTSGLVELQLKQGVTLVVEGPAEWSIEGDNRATLKQGKIVANVPKQAIGFTLDTPTARIIDHGTEFGVDVRRQGGIAVEVFQGQVRVEPATVGLAATASSGVAILLRADKNRCLETDAATGKLVVRDRLSNPLALRTAFAKREPDRNKPWDDFLTALKADNPVAVWRISKARQGIVWNEIGDRFHGQWFGDPLLPGKFDGVDDFVECKIPALRDFTTELWFKSTAPGRTDPTSPWLGKLLIRAGLPVGSKDFGVTLFGKSLYCHDTKIRVGYHGKSEIGDGRWHHVAMTRKAGQAKGFRMYVDGELEVAEDALPDEVPVGNWTFHLGASSMAAMTPQATPDKYFAGSIDMLAVYNQALDESTIKAHFETLNLTE